jgi:hypothetical protein
LPNPAAEEQSYPHGGDLYGDRKAQSAVMHGRVITIVRAADGQVERPIYSERGRRRIKGLLSLADRINADGRMAI